MERIEEGVVEAEVVDAEVVEAEVVEEIGEDENASDLNANTVISHAGKTLQNVLFGKIGKKEQERIECCLDEDIRDPFYFPALVYEKLGYDEDEDKPKRPRTAYNFFISELKKQMSHDQRKYVKSSEGAKAWKELDPSKKRKYEDLVSKDKDRYQKEVKKYEAQYGPICKKLARTDTNRREAIKRALASLQSDFLEIVSSLKTAKEMVIFQVHLHVASAMFLQERPNLIYAMPHHDETLERSNAYIDMWLCNADTVIQYEHKDNKETCIRIAITIDSVVKLHQNFIKT
jgi:hypothetical protein